MGLANEEITKENDCYYNHEEKRELVKCENNIVEKENTKEEKADK